MRKIKTNNKEAYYGSPLNELIRSEGRKDMVVINIDLAINYYKDGEFRFIESKRGMEKMGKGQEIFLQKLSRAGIDTFTIYGDAPYNSARIYSFQENKELTVDHIELLNFLNNKVKFNQLEII